MMYSECITCAKLGVTCDGPNFVAMPAPELMAWCKARKTYLGLSNGRIAELANMSKGTVDGLLASAHSDFRYETMRPVLKVLVGGQWSGDPCPDPTASERAAYEEKIRQLEAEIQWRDDKIQHLTANYNSMQTLIANTNNRHTDDKNFLKEQIKSKNRIITILATLLGLAMAVIITALVVDRLNPEIGFFWLGNLLDGGTGSLPYGTIRKIT